MQYILPDFDQEALYETETQHWVNFFGKAGVFSLTERIAKVLEINHSVFQNSCGFIYDMLALAKQSGVYKQNLIQVLDISPTSMFDDYLQNYMRNDAPTIHHIIFKNKTLQGHPSNKYNLITLGYGEHGSFHQLLQQKNHYPHTQVSKFLKWESACFEGGFLQEVQAIEQTYDDQFKKNPTALYLPEVFR